LRGNKLSGSIPTELGNLVTLGDSLSYFEHNAIYTNENSLRDFLNSKQLGGDWEATQTIAPTDMTADSPTEDTITVNWTPIRYFLNSDGYRVSWSTSPGGPYTLFDTTSDKTASTLTVTDLDPGTTHYFVVQTFTDSHELNQNTVLS
jgi:hypothetical protein